MFFKPIGTIVILLCMGFSGTLFADEKAPSKEALNTLIQEIKKAQASQKRVKMNELKILLRTMNQETRNEVMLNLKKSFAKNRPQQSDSVRVNEMARQSSQNTASQPMQPMRQGQGQGGRR